MSIVWLLVLLAACVLSGFGAAAYTRARLAHARLIAEIEDPRDTQIRELLVALKLARENSARAKVGERDAAEELSQARDRIRNQEKTLADAHKEVAIMRDNEESLIGERNRVEEELAAVRRENERLGDRIEALEVELSMAKAADLLDPGAQCP